MNNKIIAIIIAAVVVVAGVGVFLAMNNGGSDKEINIIARVNTEGSGIYLDEGQVPSDYLTVMTPAEYQVYKATMPATDKALENDHNVIVFHTGAWDMKNFGTPGITTIQHMQLKEIVEDVMGMKFLPVGGALESGTVFYNPTIPTYEEFKLKGNLTGAFIWQVQYSRALADGCEGLIMTDVLFPEHTCCVLAGSHSYMSANGDTTEAFLAAYVESVNSLNSILSAGSGEEYDALVALTVEKLGLENNESNRAVVEEALGTINYTYYDGDAKNPLKNLKEDIGSMAEKYESDEKSGVTVKLKDLGFDNGYEFADKFVDDDYLSDVLEGDVNPVSKMTTVRVAVIAGDIHQIAIQHGIAKGFFEKYNIDLDLSFQTNGAFVSVALENGEANFGFMGAPPITIKVMNSKLVTA